MNNLKNKRIYNGKIDGTIDYGQGKTLEYKKGEQDGLEIVKFKEFSNSKTYDKLSDVISYKKGEKHGADISFQNKRGENVGLVNNIKTYKKGERHGADLKFYDNGLFKLVGSYNKGQIHGAEVDFYENGLIKSIFPYNKGELQGTAFRYNEETIVINEYIYDRGKLVSSVYNHLESGISYLREYGKKQDEVKGIDKDGNLVYEAIHKDTSLEIEGGKKWDGELEQATEYDKEGNKTRSYTTNSANSTGENWCVGDYIKYYKNGDIKQKIVREIKGFDKKGNIVIEIISNVSYDEKGKEIKPKKKKMTTKELKAATSRINKQKDKIKSVDLEEVIKNMKTK
ncbi:MAG: toxin-antitoxin system YwqK family antitoxin [Alphaproteobacteria bacterium]